MKNTWRYNGAMLRQSPEAKSAATDRKLPVDIELTGWGWRILRAIPKPGVGVRQLAENLKMLGDYAGYMSMINELIDVGFLKMDKRGYVSLTRQGSRKVGCR